MKSAIISSLLVLMLAGFAVGARRCQPALLRSFGYKSLIRPNQFNPLCPNVSYNCCSNNDIMKIHKMWNSVGRNSIRGAHSRGVQSLIDLTKALVDVDSIPFQKLTEAFKKLVNPPNSFMNHLTLVTNSILQKSNGVYIGEAKKLIDSKTQAKLYEEVLKLRQGSLCAMCDWSAQKHVIMPMETNVYRAGFCFQLVTKAIDVVNTRFAVIYRYLLLIDEYLTLVSGKSIFRQRMRNQYRRYATITERCQKQPGKIEECSDFCREFNINRFTPFFDGDTHFVANFTKEIKPVADLLKSADEQTLLSYFQTRVAQWSNENVNTFVLEQSVLSPRPILLPAKNNVPRTFQPQFKTDGYKTFLEFKHVSSTIQLDTMDDEASAYPLYRLNDLPLDISSFTVVFDTIKGFNFFRSFEGSEFKMTVDELLGVLTSGGNAKQISEIIEPHVKEALDQFFISDIIDFMTDSSMFFKKLATQSKKKQEDPQAYKKVKVDNGPPIDWGEDEVSDGPPEDDDKNAAMKALMDKKAKKTATDAEKKEKTRKLSGAWILRNALGILLGLLFVL